MERNSGILMHITSLPSPYGIGTLGKAAYDFADFLQEAGQRYWQMLPVGHTGYGDSPYQSFSMYAGNPYFIDLDFLIADGLLTKEEVASCDWGENVERVDYGAIYAHRYQLLYRAYTRGFSALRPEVSAFCSENSGWLPDYALFMALKEHFHMRAWIEWEEDLRRRKPEALAAYRNLLHDKVDFYTFVQFLFFRQWERFRSYVQEKGVRLIGDLPIYAAYDSAEVWGKPEFFLLDQDGIPVEVAGVPPDFFSSHGQLWGNPLYDWAAMERDHYALWMDRIEMATRLFDVIRIDHFRGLASYYSVPFGNSTAEYGCWNKGPGTLLIDAMQRRFPSLSIIAEDLGYLTPEVMALLKHSGYPGMKVLQFAFDEREPGNYLPHTYTSNCVCYLGTHDNATLSGWLTEITPSEYAHAKAYLGLNTEEGEIWGLIRGGMGSVADLFIGQMQDYLELPPSSRMNTPGRVGGNWQWRMKADACTKELALKLAAITRRYGRYGG